MDAIDFVMIVIVVVLAIFCIGAWFAGQDQMALEICKEAGYANGIYDRPNIICHGEVKIYIQQVTDRETP